MTGTQLDNDGTTVGPTAVTTDPTTAHPGAADPTSHPAPYGWAPDRPVEEAGAGGPGNGAPATDPPTPAPPSGRLSRLVRGRPQDPAWVRPALVVLLVGTGFLYIWGLGRSGWANSFYSAAVQAGTKSWKAFFFGSFDASNFITVDKPPASLWVMEISARLFGVNAWSILVPQALEGVATVGLLFVTVRRWFSPGAALLAGAVLALTPVATLMFRYNNPDAMLTLVLTAAAYVTVRAIESGRSRWMVFAGALIGFGFITKMLQALIILPVLALVYLLAGPPKLGRRIVQLVYAGVALLLSGGWWVAAVQLTPAADRPYVGGSTNNSELNLIFGYNGFGRLTGNETGSVGGRGVAGEHVGPDRVEPPVPVVDGRTDLVVDPRLADRARRRAVADPPGPEDRSGASGLSHLRWMAAADRGRVQLRPRHHPSLLHGGAGPGDRGTGGHGGIDAVATASGALPPAGPGRGHPGQHRLGVRGPRMESHLVPGTALGHPGRRPGRRARCRPGPPGPRSAGCGHRRLRHRLDHRRPGGLLAEHGGDAAQWSHSLGRSARPGRRRSRRFRPAGGSGGFGRGGFGGGGGFGARHRNGITLPKGFTLPNGTKLPNGLTVPPGSFPRASAGGFGAGGAPGGFGAGGASGAGARCRWAPGGFGAGGGGRVPAGGAGGLLNGSTPGKQLTALLRSNASRYSWVAATTGSNSASGYQLATGDPVMAIGGFNGTDPAPTLAEFERYVADGKIHYYIGGGSGFGGGSGGTTPASQIESWVTSHFTARTVDGVTVYDLTAGSG